MLLINGISYSSSKKITKNYLNDYNHLPVYGQILKFIKKN